MGIDKFKKLLSENKLPQSLQETGIATSNKDIMKIYNDSINPIDKYMPDNRNQTVKIQPLAQEVRKWKVGDSADRVKNVFKIPTNELAKNADYVKPYGDKGAKTYGFHIDENAPLTITVSKNGEKSLTDMITGVMHLNLLPKN